MKKIFCCILMAIIILTATSTFASVTLYEKTETERISSGAILKKYKLFTSDGWISVNMIEVDLEDENTEIGLLNSENGLSTFQTVFQMANKGNVVAAINGDFFNGNYKKGNTIGLSINDGKLLTSAYYENDDKDTFGSFILSDSNDAWIDYITDKIILKEARGDATIEIDEYNKNFSKTYDTIIFTREWGEMSCGSTTDLILLEMVVENDKIVDIRYNEEPVEIPEDGYVVATFSTDMINYINENFDEKTKVELEIEYDFDVEEIKMAVSGGAVLVENGEVPNKFTSNISGLNPRTAIGISEDEKIVYLITVDGRQSSSIGMTQEELANFLIEKGVYNALNLDGGGSTTMVARRLGRIEKEIINSPSGGILRMVANAIGVYNTSKTSSLEEIVLKTGEENIFVGCERKIEVYGYDKYYNPVEINTDDIEWSIKGVDVKIQDGKIIAGNDAGSVTITAESGKAEGSITLDILSAPNEIIITPKKIAVPLGKSVDFDITAKNKNGYYASINDNEVQWEVVSGDGVFDGSVYTPSTEGNHIISVSAGNAVTYALVTTGESNEEILNNFETENFHFVSYPDAVGGNAMLTEDKKYEGSYSGKLEYDFTKTDATRASYLRFNEKINIPEEATCLSFYVYSDKQAEDYIKIKLIDAKGVTQLLMASKNIPNDEWTKVSVNLESVALPAKLVDIYVAQDDRAVKNNGEIYIDNLSITKDLSLEVSNIKLPQDVKGLDVAATSGDKESDFKIIIYDEITEPRTLLENIMKKRIEEKINLNADIAIFTSQEDKEMITNIETTVIETGIYSKTENDNGTFITIDVSNGGMKKSDYTQWLNLQEDIENAETKNIFIIMNGTLDNFSDEEERKLFIDVLCDLRRSTGKNIWVIHEGEYTTYSMERGVRYLVIGNEWIDNNDISETVFNEKYIEINIVDGNITYEIKNLLKKEEKKATEESDIEN